MKTSPAIRSRLLPGFLVALVALALAGCAARPKPVAPNRAMTVTAITVTADNASDRSFSGMLNDALYDRLGRVTRDVGEEVTVSVTVIDRGRFWTPTALVREFRQYADVRVTVISKETGTIRGDARLRSVSASSNPDAADTTLAGRIVYDIRAMLGLSGAVPSPVGGDKRPAAKPAPKPAPKLIEDTPVINEAESADPLLNGTAADAPAAAMVTPVKAIDTSKPLLAPQAADPETPASDDAPASPAAPQSARADTVSPSGIPQGLTLPASPPPVPASGAASDEPCVITLENDCAGN